MFGDTPSKGIIVIASAGLFDVVALVFSGQAFDDFIVGIVALTFALIGRFCNFSEFSSY